MAFTKILGPGIHTLANFHSHNINSSGIITATKFVGDMEPGGGTGTFDSLTVTGNLGVGGTVTYTDVTNVDAVGIITAQSGINISGGTLDIPTVAGTNTNADLSVLFQTGTGVIDGGSGLAFNPAEDSLKVGGTGTAGLNLGSQQVRGSGGSLTLTTQNNSGQCDIHLSNILVFDTGGSESLRITSAGNVGIGTTTVSKDFEVYRNGLVNAKLKGNVAGGLGAELILQNANAAANGYSEIQFQDAGTNVFSKIRGFNLTDGSNNGYMALYTSSATEGLKERVRISDAGKIGVNTTANLNAGAMTLYSANVGEGTATGQLELKDNAAYGSTPTGGIIFSGHHTTGSQAIFSGIRGFKANTGDGDYDGCLAFDVRKHGAVAYEAMRITEDGKLIISTNVTNTHAFDYAGLHFNSDNSTVAEGLFLNNTAGNTGDNVSLSFSTDSGNRKKSAISHVDTGNYGRGDLVFSIDPDADSGELDIVAHEKLRITSAGALLLGLTSPTYNSGDMQHEIKKNNSRTYTAPVMTGHSHLLLNNSDTTNGAFTGLGFRSGSGDGSIGFVYRGSSNAADFVVNTDANANGKERFRIYNNGAVLIGDHATEGGGSARLSIDCEGLNIFDGVGDAANYGLIFANDPTSNKANGIGFFNDSGSTCGGYIVHQDKGGSNIGDLVFGTASSADTPVERLRIDSNGMSKFTRGSTGTVAHFYANARESNILIQNDARTWKIVNYDYGNNGSDNLGFHDGTDDRMIIQNDGNVKIGDGNLIIGTAGHGIDFGATGGPSGGTTSVGSFTASGQILKDYEEGTWTPRWIDVNNTPTYYNQVGKYVKIGRVVHIWGMLQVYVKPTFSNPNGVLQVGGVPFSVQGVGYIGGCGGSMTIQSVRWSGSTYNDYGNSTSNGGWPMPGMSGGYQQFYVSGHDSIRGTFRRNAAADTGGIWEWYMTYNTTE